MAVDDNTIFVLGAIALNYLLLYREGQAPIKRMIGALMFIFIGISSYAYLSTDYPWGIFVAILGVLDLVFCIHKTLNS